ncbi:MAG: hypothetical protein WBC58_12275 [Maribacter stanieri]
MKKCLLYFLLLLCLGLNAQKKIYNKILADHIGLIQIDATNCYVVEVHTSLGNEISVEAEIEGEYSQDLGLEVATNGNTLIIETGFTPSFENPNDKLSAHKVISILLRLNMPVHKKLEIFGTNSRVVIDGVYKELNVSLSDGTCLLNNVDADATVKSQSGNIKVVSESAQINATSKYGKVSFNSIPYGTSTYKLETVTGNIDLSKTE